MPADPLAARLSGRGYVVLDGGLATALEARGHELSSALWSARLLVDAPGEIRAAHAAYLAAGADCVITASYQATLEGLAKAGVPAEDAGRVLALSTRLARDAVADAWGDHGTGSARAPSEPRPLVAASVGPYGAWLADGSEYDGRYGLTLSELVDFHAARFGLLAASGADLLACETIPCLDEAVALLRLLDDTDDVWCWMSFTCRDGRSLRDGTPLEEAAAMAAAHPRVAAVGINCTEPRLAGELVERARSSTDLPVLAYPNSGESYDPIRKRWREDRAGSSWMEGCEAAWRAGARILGGCCRTGPAEIGRLRRHLETGDWGE